MLVSCYHRGSPSSFLRAPSVEGKGTKGGDARPACRAGPARPGPGTVLPEPSRAPRALPTPGGGPPAPAEPRTGKRPSLPHTPTNTLTPRTRRAPRFPSSQEPRLDLTAVGPSLPPQPGHGARSPRSGRGRAGALPPPATGPRRALPRPDRTASRLSRLDRAAPGSPLRHPPLTGPRPVLPRSPRGSAPRSRSLSPDGGAPSSALPLSRPSACPGPSPAAAHRGRPCLPTRGLATPSRRSPPFESTTRWRRLRGRGPGAGRHSNGAVQGPPRRLPPQSGA